MGTANSANLIATLVPGGGVLGPGSMQSYGVLTAGGPAVTRPFTFTADPSLPCGSTLTVTLSLQDGSFNLGTVIYTFLVGIAQSIQPDDELHQRQSEQSDSGPGRFGLDDQCA